MASTVKFSRDQLEKALQKKIFKWVDGVMKQEIPADIYSSAHSGNYDDMMRANGWLKERGYRVVGQGDGIHQIFRGATLIKQTTMTLELSDPDDLVSVMEVAKDNMNIPPPPWQPKAE